MAKKKTGCLEKMIRAAAAAACLAALGASPTMAATVDPASTTEAPPSLTQWKGWIEQSNPSRQCANQSPEACLWLGPLSVEAAGANRWSAKFEATNLSSAPAIVHLPGDDGSWPMEAKIGGIQAPIGKDQAGPYVMLGGRVSASVVVSIDTRRASSGVMAIPPGFVIANVKDAQGRERSIDPSQGLAIAGAAPDPEEKVEQAPKATKDASLPAVKISRLIQDAQVPLLTTRVKIDNGGKRSAILIEHLLPEGSIPVQMTAPGAQLSAAGLAYEAPPGSSVISVVSRLDPALAIHWSVPQSSNAQIDATEFVFVKNDERVRKLVATGKAVDPKAIDPSLAFPGLPAYELSKQEPLSFEAKPIERLGLETKAGAASEAWLDFAGDEVFMKQELTFAKVSQGWFEPLPGWQATQATANGSAAIVAKSEKGDAGRIPLYEGLGNLTVGMKSPAGMVLSLPAVASEGISATQAQTILHLPLGWRVLAVAGDGYSSNGWLASMTLWDWFLVIITVWAAKSLLGWRPALAVLGAMLFGRFFFGAPFGVYLPILCGLALARHLPVGGFKTASLVGTGFLALCLIAAAAPFTMSRIQKTLHSSLEDSGQPSAGDGLGGQWRAKNEAPAAERQSLPGGGAAIEQDGSLMKEAAAPAEADAPAPAPVAVPRMEMAPAGAATSSLAAVASSLSDKRADLPKKGYSAPVEGAQAGEGEPAWTAGTVVRVVQSGPSSSKTMSRIFLIAPWLVKVLSLATLACLWASVFFMAKHGAASRLKIASPSQASTSAATDFSARE